MAEIQFGAVIQRIFATESTEDAENDTTTRFTSDEQDLQDTHDDGMKPRTTRNDTEDDYEFNRKARKRRKDETMTT